MFIIDIGIDDTFYLLRLDVNVYYRYRYRRYFLPTEARCQCLLSCLFVTLNLELHCIYY